MSSSWVPLSATTPPAMTMILSASRMVLSRWAIAMDGLALHELFEGVDYQFFGFAVEGGGGLVEQEDGVVADHDAGDADALALASGESGAALADQGVVAEGHFGDELVGVGQLRGGR